MIGSLVIEDDMDFPCARSTNIRTEHDSIRRVSIHLSLIEIAGEELDVATSTIDILLMLDAELNYLENQ